MTQWPGRIPSSRSEVKIKKGRAQGDIWLVSSAAKGLSATMTKLPPLGTLHQCFCCLASEACFGRFSNTAGKVWRRRSPLFETKAFFRALCQGSGLLERSLLEILFGNWRVLVKFFLLRKVITNFVLCFVRVFPN